MAYSGRGSLEDYDSSSSESGPATNTAKPTVATKRKLAAVATTKPMASVAVKAKSASRCSVILGVTVAALLAVIVTVGTMMAIDLYNNKFLVNNIFVYLFLLEVLYILYW